MGAVGASLLTFAVACATGTQSDPTLDANLTQGGSAGDASGGTGAVAGDTSTAGTGGSDVAPIAGTAPIGGGGMAGTDSGGMGGMGGTGGMAGGGMGGGGTGGGGMGGTAGTGGAGPTGYRYARFVAKTEQRADKVWSSCAELELQTTGGANIPRTGWIITADSQETEDEMVPATLAIDGDINTFWHTAWEPAPDDVNDAKLPHQLVVDLGSAKVITGFSYLPRQVGENGRVKDWEFYVSNTNGNWGTPVKTGSFPAGTTLQKITF